MSEVKTTTYEDLVKMLQDNINTGNLTKTTGNSLRSTLSRVLKEVYSDNWRQVNLNQIDVEQLLDQYSSKAKDKYRPRDLMITRSRIRRVFRIAKGDARIANPKQKPEVNQKTMDIDRNIQLMSENYNVFNSFFMSTLRKVIFSKESEKYNNFYALPATVNKIAGLSLPKDLTITELKRIHNLIDGIFTCEEYSRKGGPD